MDICYITKNITIETCIPGHFVTTKNRYAGYILDRGWQGINAPGTRRMPVVYVYVTTPGCEKVAVFFPGQLIAVSTTSVEGFPMDEYRSFFKYRHLMRYNRYSMEML